MAAAAVGEVCARVHVRVCVRACVYVGGWVGEGEGDITRSHTRQALRTRMSPLVWSWRPVRPGKSCSATRGSGVDRGGTRMSRGDASCIRSRYSSDSDAFFYRFREQHDEVMPITHNAETQGAVLPHRAQDRSGERTLVYAATMRATSVSSICTANGLNLNNSAATAVMRSRSGRPPLSRYHSRGSTAAAALRSRRSSPTVLCCVTDAVATTSPPPPSTRKDTLSCHCRGMRMLTVDPATHKCAHVHSPGPHLTMQHRSRTDAQEYDRVTTK
jgi:hypothetical protein